MTAQEAELEEVANSKLRCPLAYTETFICADFKFGGSVFSHKAPSRKSQPKWRGPAWILDTDETGVAARYRSQTFKVARNCLRRRQGEEEVGDKEGPSGLGARGDR